LLPFFQSVVSFNHPGLLVTDSELARAKINIAAGLDPWLSSWNELTSISFADASYQSNAVSAIYRSADGVNAENGELLWHDIAAAFALGLRWKISGNDSYADTAGWILTSWGQTLTTLGGGGSDKYLTSGLQGYELANAAELLRDYEPFAANLSIVTDMLHDVFLPLNELFLRHEDPAEHNVLHFFANWELANIASMMAFGVLTDNTTAWDFAVNYLKNGTGNGAINHAVTNLVVEPETGNLLGQGQEEGRDQGHSVLDFQLLAAIAQQAWNQGEDLFAFNNSRILQGAEYFARYNLGYDVPFENYTNGIVSYSTISNASRGATRPTWELLYSHYTGVKGLDAPWTAEYLNYTLNAYGGFEGGAGSLGEGSGNYDGLGWGSLLYR
ncbi:chondroitin AC/alginate lyase, partial [Cryphonectria parasitica EP155]